MTPQQNNDDIDQLLLRFDRLDSKVDDLRRELMASFVLKQVFDVVVDQIRKDMEKRENSWKNWISIIGGASGIIAILTAILSHIK